MAFLFWDRCLGVPLATAAAQYPPGQQGSSNVQVLSHRPLDRIFTVGDIELEQELSRPFAYVGRTEGAVPRSGFNIVSVADPNNAKLLYYWQIEDPELHASGGGGGCLDNKYFKLRDRYYDIQACQFRQGRPDHDLGAVVFDVTGLPDTSRIEEIGRIRAPDTGGGFHNIFAYKHSDGRVLLFTTTSGPHSNVYDMGRFVSGDPDPLASRIPVPDTPGTRLSYHDMYVGFDPATRQDRFYGGGAGGYYVFDVTRPDDPRLLTSITGVAGMSRGHTFTPSPDGRYAVAETEYQYAPLRMFDLKPGLEGEVKTISRPIGAYTPRWRGLPHPYTVGYYDTYEGPHQRGKVGGDAERGWLDPTYVHAPPSATTNGAFGVDVRNADGLIVISDEATGFWVLKMDGFDGWNGHQWGMPNISSVQDWDNGPEGAAPARMSLQQ